MILLPIGAVSGLLMPLGRIFTIENRSARSALAMYPFDSLWRRSWNYLSDLAVSGCNMESPAMWRGAGAQLPFTVSARGLLSELLTTHMGSAMQLMYYPI